MNPTCHYAVSTLLCATLISGCALPHGQVRAPHGRAFISYFGPAKPDGRLRLAVKDLIDLKGEVTTAGSRYLARNSPPATEDAACLTIARERNVEIVGKTNMSEFAISPSGLNEFFGNPRNPLLRKRHGIPGGSSSGSAAAVASGLADVALGSDTTGSIRLPAACCGIVGLKTTLGLVSLKGVVPIEPWHLDTIGPLARDIAHEVQGMELLERGFAAKYAEAETEKPTAHRIKLGRLYLKGTDPVIDKAVDAALAKAGFQVIPLGDDFRDQWEKAQSDCTTVAAAGAWLSDRQYSDKPGVSTTTKAIILLGHLEYNLRYRAALQRIPPWQQTLRRVFQRVDFIALPTAQAFPPKVPFWGSSVLFEAQTLKLQNTAPANLAGVPALAVPIPVEDKNVSLTSLELVGPPKSEAKLLNAGRLVEKTRTPADLATGIGRTMARQ